MIYRAERDNGYNIVHASSKCYSIYKNSEYINNIYNTNTYLYILNKCFYDTHVTVNPPLHVRIRLDFFKEILKMTLCSACINAILVIRNRETDDFKYVKIPFLSKEEDDNNYEGTQDC